MDIDGALFHVHAAAPDVVQQLGARIDALGMGHEEVQQAVLGGADLDRLVLASAIAREHPVRRAVDAQPADTDAAVLVVLARTAQHGADAGQQLACRERFDDVVVDSRFQSADAIVLLAAGGQHDDRDLAGQRFAPPATGQLQAAGAREHPVQQDEVRHAVGDGGLRLAGVAGVHRVVFALAQGEGDHVADGGFVFDDQDAFLHAVTGSWERGRTVGCATDRLGRASTLPFYDWVVTPSHRCHASGLSAGPGPRRECLGASAPAPSG